MQLEGADPPAAQKGQRAVYLGRRRRVFGLRQFMITKKLRPGNVIEGPAVVEGGVHDAGGAGFDAIFHRRARTRAFWKIRPAAWKRRIMPIPTLAEKLEWLKPAPATDYERNAPPPYSQETTKSECRPPTTFSTKRWRSSSAPRVATSGSPAIRWSRFSPPVGI